jgi:hypothetical protein
LVRLAVADASGTVSSPKARFIQWKAVLNSNGTRSPRLSSVKIPYLQQNFRPEVTTIDVLPSGVLLQKTPSIRETISIPTIQPPSGRTLALGSQESNRFHRVACPKGDRSHFSGTRQIKIRIRSFMTFTTAPTTNAPGRF